VYLVSSFAFQPILGCVLVNYINASTHIHTVDWHTRTRARGLLRSSYNLFIISKKEGERSCDSIALSFDLTLQCPGECCPVCCGDPPFQTAGVFFPVGLPLLWQFNKPATDPLRIAVSGPHHGCCCIHISQSAKVVPDGRACALWHIPCLGHEASAVAGVTSVMQDGP